MNAKRLTVLLRGRVNRRLPHCGRHGFTLVEMLVVISIIAVLASLLVPALQNALTAGRQVQCASNLKSVGIAMHQYISDNGGIVPRPTYDQAGTLRAIGNPWDWVILPYTNNMPQIFRCPEDTTLRGFYATTPQSYLINHDANKKTIVDPNAPTGKPIARIRNISSVFFVACGNNMYTHYANPATAATTAFVGCSDAICVSYGTTHWGSFGTTAGINAVGHAGGTNFLNGDNSAVHLLPPDFEGYWIVPYGEKSSKKRWYINQ